MSTTATKPRPAEATTAEPAAQSTETKIVPEPLANPQSRQTLDPPMVPDVDLLGKGYDLLALNPLDLADPRDTRYTVIAFENTEADTQVTPDGSWRYPKGTDYTSGAGGEINNQATCMFSAHDFQNRFKAIATAGAGVPGLVEFSASTTYEKFRQTTTTQTSMWTFTDMLSHTFSLALWLEDGYSADLHLDNHFRSRVNALPTSQGAAYDQMIRDFGTHFPRRADFGGRARQEIQVLSETFAELTSEEIDVSVEATATFETATVKGGGGTKTKSQERFDSATKDYQSNVSYSGGTTALSFQAWLDSVPHQPVPIALDLLPLNILLNKKYFPQDASIETKANLLKAAISTYLKTRGIESTLAYRYATAFQLAWNDKDSGGDHDGAFYKAVGIPQGYHAVGDYGQNNYHAPKGNLMLLQAVREESTPALAKPKGFTRIWKDKDSGAKKDGSFWRMTPPAGYVSLGDVVMSGHSTEPDPEMYRCVRQDLCEKGVVSEKKIWNDKDTGADKDFSVWSIVPKEGSSGLNAGTFYAKTGHSHPDKAEVWVLKASAL